MDILFVLIIIGILVCVITGNLGYILYGASLFLLVMSGLLVVIFALCSILLLTSKWKDAKFLRVDLPGNGSKFKVAFYQIDGEEVACLFPEEGVFRKIFYRTDRNYRVLVHPKLGRAFDRFAVATCILGLVSGVGLGAALIAMYF